MLAVATHISEESTRNQTFKRQMISVATVYLFILEVDHIIYDMDKGFLEGVL